MGQPSGGSNPLHSAIMTRFQGIGKTDALFLCLKLVSFWVSFVWTRCLGGKFYWRFVKLRAAILDDTPQMAFSICLALHLAGIFFKRAPKTV